MFVSLLMLGLLLTAAGFVTVGFGIPINAFSLGNTLIIAGAIGIAGGLILIGLAAAVRQLNRIAETLKASARAVRPADLAAEPSLAPPTARMPSVAVPPPPPRAPVPPKPPELNISRPSEQRSAEPRVAAPSSSDGPGPLDWLRPKSKSTGHEPTGNGEPPVVEISDEAPLSPRSTPRPALSPLANMAEPMLEPKAWPPSRSDDSRDSKSGSRSDQIPRVTPPGERSGENRARESGLFDVVWPDSKSGRPGSDAVESRPEAPPLQSRDEPMPEKRGEVSGGLAAERPVAILKSGVIDGMAYTLYADGSIEAELPQGTVRFASVDALRSHLEQNA